MFTKYNGINLPKNYSGTKFKQPAEDTKMKTHRAQDEKPITKGVIRTSVSPSFQSALDKTMQEANAACDVSYSLSEDKGTSFTDEGLSLSVSDDNNSFLTEGDENASNMAEEYDSTNDLSNIPKEKDDEAGVCMLGDTEKNTCKEKNDYFPLSLLKESGLGRLIEGVNKDDLLLIALIVLFARENLDTSLDAIVILALLLLYR